MNFSLCQWPEAMNLYPSCEGIRHSWQSHDIGRSGQYQAPTFPILIDDLFNAQKEFGRPLYFIDNRVPIEIFSYKCKILWVNFDHCVGKFRVYSPAWGKN